MNPTLADWLEADETTRAVFMDWLLERIPLGYRDQRETDHSTKVFPRFVHEETGVLFHVIFGGPAVMGMTPQRWERVLRARRAMQEANPFTLALREDLRDAISPPCEVMVETALVAERPLVFGQLRKMGIDESLLSSGHVELQNLGTLLAKLPRFSWRAPSEAEWEYALRAFVGDEQGWGPAADSVVSEEDAYEGRAPFRALTYELCCDDFAPTLDDYPRSGSRGNGHTVVRSGPATSWRTDFRQAAWPTRTALAQARTRVSLRPWVSLRSR